MSESSNLTELERALHCRAVRSDSRQLEALLHESFVEIGRSGRAYERPEILAELASGLPPTGVWSQDFIVLELSPAVALLTYVSAHIDADGSLSGHTLRSSIWQGTAAGWQIRFHQGTPSAAFTRSANGVASA